ncbi:MAG: hypothetical protein [Caudoviricetes sp.]|nr:MAG: hypothetical protein [Caudoviricetes sp.]
MDDMRYCLLYEVTKMIMLFISKRNKQKDCSTWQPPLNTPENNYWPVNVHILIIMHNLLTNQLKTWLRGILENYVLKIQNANILMISHLMNGIIWHP